MIRSDGLIFWWLGVASPSSSWKALTPCAASLRKLDMMYDRKDEPACMHQSLKGVRPSM